MKNIRSLSVVLVASCILFACSSNRSTSAGNGGTASATPDNSGGGSSTGNERFSYTVDGNKTAVKSLYINKVENIAGGRLNIEVTNTSTSEVFKFSIANTGSTTVLHYKPLLSNFGDKTSNAAEYMSPKLKNYYADSVIVTVTSFDASHVAATFSGKYLSGGDKPIPLEITDGSFDLPFKKDTDK